MKTFSIYSKDNLTGAVWCVEHAGKMAGVPSLSTSPKYNKRCALRSETDGSICQKCYSARYIAMRPALQERLWQNSEILTEKVYPAEEWPIINALIARFESFGELNNTTQFVNYCNMCIHNPHTMFALWTKNLNIIKRAFDECLCKKPDNLIIIQSSVMLNQEERPKYDWVDKVFTCYTSGYIEEHDVEINCGSRECVTCQKCYHKNIFTSIKEKQK